MSENVRDRDELLLNAIVTGDTSGIDPRDREETFIKAIAEKKTGPFYPAGAGYLFTTDNGNITAVYDYNYNILELEKIAPADFVGEKIGVDGAELGSVIKVELGNKKYFYNTVRPLNNSVTFYSVTIDFINKTIFFNTVVSLTP